MLFRQGFKLCLKREVESVMLNNKQTKIRELQVFDKTLDKRKQLLGRH
jgi:hypothetical protein